MSKREETWDMLWAKIFIVGWGKRKIAYVDETTIRKTNTAIQQGNMPRLHHVCGHLPDRGTGSPGNEQ